MEGGLVVPASRRDHLGRVSPELAEPVKVLGTNLFVFVVGGQQRHNLVRGTLARARTHARVAARGNPVGRRAAATRYKATRRARKGVGGASLCCALLVAVAVRGGDRLRYEPSHARACGAEQSPQDDAAPGCHGV